MGLDKKEADAVANLLKSPKMKFRKLFLDWTPELKAYIPSFGEIKTLEYAIFRGCRIDDDTFRAFLSNAKTNGLRLKLIDFYSNQLTDASTEFVSSFTSDYKYIESFGFGLNQIRKLSNFHPLLERTGTIETTKVEFDNYLAGLKNKEAVIAKNAKLKAAKKPEDPLPYLEEVTFDEGTGKYHKKQYPGLQFVNLIGNQLEPEPFDKTLFLDGVLTRAPQLYLLLNFTKIEKSLDPKMLEKHGGSRILIH